MDPGGGQGGDGMDREDRKRKYKEELGRQRMFDLSKARKLRVPATKTNDFLADALVRYDEAAQRDNVGAAAPAEAAGPAERDNVGAAAAAQRDNVAEATAGAADRTSMPSSSSDKGKRPAAEDSNESPGQVAHHFEPTQSLSSGDVAREFEPTQSVGLGYEFQAFTQSGTFISPGLAHQFNPTQASTQFGTFGSRHEPSQEAVGSGYVGQAAARQISGQSSGESAPPSKTNTTTTDSSGDSEVSGEVREEVVDNESEYDLLLVISRSREATVGDPDHWAIYWPEKGLDTWWKRAHLTSYDTDYTLKFEAGKHRILAHSRYYKGSVPCGRVHVPREALCNRIRQVPLQNGENSWNCQVWVTDVLRTLKQDGILQIEESELVNIESRVDRRLPESLMHARSL